jgi:hypothetical protein
MNKSKGWKKVLIIAGLSIIVSNNLIQFVLNLSDYPPTIVLFAVLIAVSIINPFVMEALK